MLCKHRFHADKQCTLTSIEGTIVVKVLPSVENVRLNYLLDILFGSFFPVFDALRIWAADSLNVTVVNVDIPQVI